ncbi:alpha-1,2-fucosyltransferase [Psychromonas algicola]|uniref:alpha-1,2-fucosyltransferase n=1 Tax=Psychromonas algicola TaxID=2555642 RepID=UPI001068AA0A|nr:alpha-1,2-fucosyltransferase [Psychromonas sp. RZ5]TEW50705.1 alpha-1,2-fucosyltransferase [Psychromonas sp. RZ5]
MIITKINGGLGNQLFQYAVGRAVAIHHSVPLKLDISAFINHKIHNGFRLDAFNVDAEIANNQEIIRLAGNKTKITRFFRKLGLIKKKNYCKEKRRTIFDARVFEQTPYYLDGYWQNEMYFSAIRQLILKELTPKNELSYQAKLFLREIMKCNSISLHVRRGDYLKHPEIGVLDLDYYQRAIEYIGEIVDSPVFFIFSNDLKWCKKNFNFLKNCVYVKNTETEIDDLILMSKCKHNIVANSSFSWWGAWLNENDGKIIVSPSKWMAHNPYNNKWVPDSWLQF